MRVALFTETFLPKIDGIVTRLRYTISELQKQGDQVLVFAPGEGITEYEGAQIVRMPGSRFPLYPELTLSLPRASMRRQLVDFKPDIIHVADPVCLAIAGLYYSNVLRLPLVASYHTRLPKYLHYYGLGAVEPLVWKAMRFRHNRADMNLCTSTVMAQELMDHGVERVHLWPRAVDTECFHPRFRSQPMRDWLSGGESGKPLFLYVGRLSPEKEIEKLRTVLEAVAGSRIAIIGGGPHRQRLEQYFSGLPAFFAGYLTGQRLAEAMASVDALILPSQTETLGLVLMEAMAAGSIVIGAHAGGITDVIENGINGYLFDPKSAGDLARVVAGILRKPAQSESVRRQARVQAENWSWTAATLRLKTFYTAASAMPRKDESPKSLWRQAARKAAIGGIKTFLP